MYWKLCTIIFLAILRLVGCSVVNLMRSTATPIPEKPLSDMSPHPSKGVSGADSIGDTYIPTLGNSGYDVQQYNLEMEFSNQLDAITSTVTISSVVTLDDLGRISLDFSGYHVDGVKVGDRYAVYYRSPDKLYIDLPKVLANGNELVVKVSYYGPIESYKSRYISVAALGLRTIPGNDLIYAFAEPDGAHAWYPCNDHPLDKAAYRFRLTVPKGITAVANGTLLDTVFSGEQEIFIWSEEAPMATYLATVVVGYYKRIDAPAVGDVKIRHYVFEGDFDYTNQLSSTQRMLDYYSNLIGPYPYNEFGYIVIRTIDDESRFAEESQTMVEVDRGWLVDSQAMGVLAPELVHQWFGDSVSVASWNEVWLKEGMANYLMVMWLDDQDFVSITTLMADLENVLLTHASELNYPLNQPPSSNMYGANTYDKGAWVFHMLRQEIGNENFSRFLREYYQRFAGGIASTAELQQVAEEVSGMDLNTFFQQWVYGSGFPDLNITWTSQPDSVTVQVCQVNTGQVFALPLDIELDGRGGKSEQQVIQLDQFQEQVTYTTSYPVSALIVDPDQNVLADIAVTQVDALTGCTP